MIKFISYLFNSNKISHFVALVALTTLTFFVVAGIMHTTMPWGPAITGIVGFGYCLYGSIRDYFNT